MSNAAMSTEHELLYSARDGIGHIVLNRPHRRNALTFGMYDPVSYTHLTLPTILLV